MNDDFLTQYTRALADEHDGATAVPEATRARVIRNLAERGPRRSKWLVMGIPLLAVLGGSTAWAAASGQLAPLVQRATVALGIAPAESPTEEPSGPTPSRGNRTPPAQDVEDTERTEPAPNETEPSREEEADSGREGKEEHVEAAPIADSGSTPTHPTPPSEAASNAAHEVARAQARPETIGDRQSAALIAAQEAQRTREAVALAAYEAAHDAHFSEGNCSKAVAGYADYLRRFPGGGFAIEARYNRGLCLAQMGRASEARAALQPFADGAFGNYRRAKAAALIDALAK